MSTRKSSSNRRTAQPSSPAQSSDGGGCLLVVLFVLWWSGFVSFHSRETGRTFQRAKEVQEQLAEAQVELVSLTNALQAMKGAADTLLQRKGELERQVDELENSRERIARSIAAASDAVSAGRRPGWQNWANSVFAGTLGNLLSAAITALLVAFIARGAVRSLWTRFWSRATKPGT